MLFGVLSAIALGIGVTATAQDLIDQESAARPSEPVVEIQEVRQEADVDTQEAGLDIADWDY